VIERLGDCALLRFKLDTGRAHQIRMHCAHMSHPISGERLVCEAPLPPLFDKLLQLLRRSAGVDPQMAQTDVVD
jgi:23S rRNA pseudouridine1911/1915/1917 synthase